MADVVLSAFSRVGTGKGVARALRRAGRIPAVIYGGITPLSVAVETRAFLKVAHVKGYFSRILTLDLEGRTVRVLPRAVQYHPVTDVPEHADFQEVVPGNPIAVTLPITFTNIDRAVGTKRGGVFNIVYRTIKVACDPDHIPDAILLDVANLDIGRSIHLRDVPLPPSAKPFAKLDATIATMTGRADSSDAG
jgi:large subunit ribosomal protein L25